MTPPDGQVAPLRLEYRAGRGGHLAAGRFAGRDRLEAADDAVQVRSLGGIEVPFRLRWVDGAWGDYLENLKFEI